MIPNDQPLRRQTIQRMLKHITNDREEDKFFSKWEEDFINSISDQFADRGDLSQKQCEILEKLYDR